MALSTAGLSSCALNNHPQSTAARFVQHFLLRYPEISCGNRYIIATLHSGRVARNDYASDAEYEQALKSYDREADLLAGVIPKTKAAKK